MNFLDLTGMKFDRLTARWPAGRQGKRHPSIMWLASCDCGRLTVVGGSRLRSGNTKSCGCRNSEVAEARVLIHGHGRHDDLSPEYRTWKAMRQRCMNPRAKNYRHYGGRGITVCERWNTFTNFLADMGPKPKGRSIDRINNDGNYEPSNCRWATPKEQAKNTRKRRGKAA